MEPIAIIGIGCRLPGEGGATEDIKTPNALWDYLQQKKDSYTDFPPSRLNVDAWYHPDESRAGAFYTRGGCFLKEDPRQFDPSFFGISPQETNTLDPSSRKLLETAYEAFESSGTSLQALSGSSTGCFIGNFNSDHQVMQYRDTEYKRPYGMTGGDLSLLSNRISYLFNLQGPSCTVNTACSSSMYALHLACSSIRLNECDGAVVGGSNLLLSPDPQVFSAGLHGVSKTSCCHTFDAEADGYARSEGVCVLYIKALSKAIRDNDPIRAVIRSTAANANGRTGGITHPDPSAQERLIREAYARGGDLDPRDTYYLECHGTGTPTGDPLEVEAVGRVFAGCKSKSQPLLIGSIKTNIGHSEATSGIAGIIKTVLAIEKGVIPPVRSLGKLNPNMNLRDGRIQVVRDSTSWPKGMFRRASVSSFGYGGANAHVILEELEKSPPASSLSAGVPSPHDRGELVRSNSSSSYSELDGAYTPGTPMSLNDSSLGNTSDDLKQLGHQMNIDRDKFFLLPLSAHNEQTLRENTAALCSRLEEWDFSDLAYTLGCRRSHLSYRSFLVTSLSEIEKDRTAVNNPIVKKIKPQQASRLGFIFTGQGAQWPQMGKELMDCFPIYLQSIRYMDRVLSQLPFPPDWTMEGALSAPAETSRVYEASFSQTLVTAIQVAIVDLLCSWNIHPVASIGHSSGEIAAAYASGLLSAAEAIVVAYARGRAASRNAVDGAMLAVAMDSTTAQRYLATRQGINIACENSPESTTISGDRSSIIELKAALDSEKAFARIVETGGKAYHSPHMKLIGGGYEEELDLMLNSLSLDDRSTLQSPSRFVSSVTCSTDVKRPVKSSYWRKNLESPVLFKGALKKMLSGEAVDCLVEIGPHSALRGPIRQIIASLQGDVRPEYLPTLVRKEHGVKNVLQTAGSLWARGYGLSFPSVNTRDYLTSDRKAITRVRPGRVITDLPTYRWQYGELNYFENRWSREWRSRTHPRHDILGSRQPGCNANEPMWRNVLTENSLPWLNDHKIGADTVFPAAAYVMMAVEAAMQMSELKGMPRATFEAFTCEDLHLTSALIIPEGSEGVEVLFNLRRSRQNDGSFQPNRYEFTVTSVASSPLGDVFEEHAHGAVTAIPQQSESQEKSLTAVECKKPVSADRWYDTFEQNGLRYSASFKRNAEIMASYRNLSAQSVVQVGPSDPYESEYAVHPSTLDASIQVSIIAAHGGRFSECTSGFLPTQISKLTIWPSNADALPKTITATCLPTSKPNILSQVSIGNSDGRSLVRIEDLQIVKQTIVHKDAQKTQPFTRLEWRPDVSLLSSDDVERLWAPPSPSEGQSGLQLLDELVLNQIVLFQEQHGDVLENGCKAPNLERLLEWFRRQIKLIQQGSLQGSRAALERSTEERAQFMSQLRAKLMVTNAPETQILCHMYESLPLIFSGEMTGIQAATQNNYLSLWYEHMALFSEGSAALTDLVALLSFQNPSMSIFEIGGGTGSATRQVLRSLKGERSFRGYDTYTFTDIGPAFLAQAQTEFKNCHGLKYAPFDMEKPISDQGFNANYDLVIASNVIHVTKNIQNTLQNVRRLLRPGGKLVLLEIVRPTLFWTMILGTFSDYWKGDFDPAWPRYEGPFLTKDMWQSILPQCGFSGLDISLDHFTGNGEAAVMSATAIEPATALYPSLSQKSVTIVHRESPSDFTIRVQDFFEKQGYTVRLSALDGTCAVEDERVICLAEVDGSLFDNCSEAEWTNAKKILLKSASVLWVTGGNLLDAGAPESATVAGLLSAVRAAKKSARNVTLDLDSDGISDAATPRYIFDLENRASTLSTGDDFEFRLKNGLIHCSRLVEDESLQYEDTEKPFDEIILNKEASYLLVDCFGELGQSLSQWMISHGAKRLVYLSHSLSMTRAAQDFIDNLKQIHIDVQVIQSDTTRDFDLHESLTSVVQPVQGIVWMAPQSIETSFEDLSLGEFNESFGSTRNSITNLHKASLGMELDFFVTVTSWGSVLGMAGHTGLQASDAFANAFSGFRQRSGLPATSLSLGQILDIGEESRDLDRQEELTRNGLYGNSEREYLHFCESALRHTGNPRSGQGHLLAGVEPAGLLTHATRCPLESMSWYSDPRFAYLVQAVHHTKNDSASTADSSVSLEDDNASEPLVMRIKKRIARNLYIAADDIDQQQPIGAYGIDSLVASEIRGWLRKVLGADVSTLKLLHPTMSIEKLAVEVESSREKTS